MKRLNNVTLLRLALILGAVMHASFLSADIIITEVADGTLTGQQPKFVEITNVGTTSYTFPAGGGIINQNNTNTDYDVDWDLEGVTLAPGQSWVVNSLTPAGADSATFVALFGKDADQYADVAFGNGDDRYIITDGTSFLDIYGVDKEDATPTGGVAAEWAYVDGYAYRKPGITTGKGLDFDPTEWVFGGSESLLAGTEGEQIILAQTLLTPGFYDSGITPGWAGYTINEFGIVDTMDWMGYLEVNNAPWIWAYELNGWIYVLEEYVTESGSWIYVPQN